MATDSEISSSDERTFLRMPYDSSLEITCQGGMKGQATSRDVGRGGLRLGLNRYLRPGHHLMIRTFAGEELKAQVVWCRPDRDATRFIAGVRVIHDEPQVYETMARMMYRAVRTGGEAKRPAFNWPRPARAYSAAGMGIAAAATVAIQQLGH